MQQHKRKLPDTTDSPSAKRPCPPHADGHDPDAIASHERPRNHPVYGQKSAFPGLDAGRGDELFYGPAEDGMEYLRMVR
jgi:regulator of vacuolar morphogenesis